jgi:acyl-coenzyme A thioesterase PaaI-like protein
MATQIHLDAAWTISGHINGGYLAACVADVASRALDGAPPLTLSVHYLAAARGGGPADVEIEVLRRGRLATARVSLSREGTALLEAIVTAGTPRVPEQALDVSERPDLPPWDECHDAIAGWDGATPGMELLGHLETRLHPGDSGTFTGGPPRLPARFRGWVGYRDGSPADRSLALAAWDALPPTPWAAHLWGHTPTVNAQLLFFPGEVVGPLQVEARCDTVRDGVADETARVWDSTGRLVVAARQSALLLPA